MPVQVGKTTSLASEAGRLLPTWIGTITLTRRAINVMCQMWTALKTYQGFISKSGIVEVFRDKVWCIALEGNRRIALAIIMHFVKQAEKKVQKTKEERP